MKISASHIIFSAPTLFYVSICLSFLWFSFISFLFSSSFFLFFVCVSCSPGFLQIHKVAENDLEYLTLLLLPLECWDYRCALSHFFLIFSVEWDLNHCPYLCKARTPSAELCVQTLVSSYPQTKLQEQTSLIHFPQMHTLPVVFPSSLVLSLVYFSSS